MCQLAGSSIVHMIQPVLAGGWGQVTARNFLKLVCRAVHIGKRAVALRTQRVKVRVGWTREGVVRVPGQRGLLGLPATNTLGQAHRQSREVPTTGADQGEEGHFC